MRSLKSYETFAYALTWKYTTREDTQGGGVEPEPLCKKPFFHQSTNGRKKIKATKVLERGVPGP